jgi:vacuolar protein sorting-associated protein 35
MPPKGDEQKDALDAALKVVQNESFHMKRSLDAKNLREALKHSAVMISELRTPVLSPKNYYQLYMAVLDELTHMEQFFNEMRSSGKRMADLYELVQHAGNILPRMYLLITVGSVFIQSQESACKDILKDLVEMCRGVQHPMRGLFLRNYLSQMSKDKLPDVDSPYEGAGGSVKDAIDFIVQNFTEMNKLWVRMQHQGPIRDKEKREKERRDLRILVGTNLVRLSQLEGVNEELYKTVVLPRTLEQITNCKDFIAQEYLMDCLIQVFPDELHMATLDTFLNTCTQLQSGVNVKNIFVSLMDRLAAFAQNNPKALEGVKAFSTFTQYISKVIQQQANLSLENILGLQVSLVNFALKAYPEQIRYVDHILRFCGQFIEKKKGDDEALTMDCIEHLEQLLTIPLRSYKSVMDVLALQHYTGLLTCLEPEQRNNVAVQVAKSVVRNQTPITDLEKMERLLDLLKPLLEEQEGDDSMDEDAQAEFKEQQSLIAAMVHLVTNESVDDHFRLLNLLRKRMGAAGPKRIGITMPGLVMAAIRLAVKVRQLEQVEKNFQVSAKKVLEFVHQTMTKAMGPDFPETTFRLYLMAAQAANVCGFSNITYEFTTQAYYLYETAIADSKEQIDAITLMVGCIQNLRILSEEEYETFSTKTTLYASRLLRKADQCRMLSLCANLFWSPDYSEECTLDLLAGPHEITIRHGKRAVEALRRAVKMASECEANLENVPLYVDLLNVYLYHYGKENDAIDVKWVNALISLIKDNIDKLPHSSPTKDHYERTVSFIAKKAMEDSRYAAIALE